MTVRMSVAVFLLWEPELELGRWDGGACCAVVWMGGVGSGCWCRRLGPERA